MERLLYRTILTSIDERKVFEIIEFDTHNDVKYVVQENDMVMEIHDDYKDATYDCMMRIFNAQLKYKYDVEIWDYENNRHTKTNNAGTTEYKIN